MASRDPIERLITELEDPEVQEALSKMVELARNLERSGLLDILLALTEPEVVKRAVEMFITTGTMKLGDSLDKLLDKLGDIAETLEEDVEPITLGKLLVSIKDPEVARGLARLIAILKVLGK